MVREKPCSNKKCKFYCKDKYLLHCNGFRDGKFHCIDNCTGYIAEELSLIVDKTTPSSVVNDYFIKPLGLRVSLKDRIKAAFLVFMGKACAHIWYREEDIKEKLSSLIPYYKERKVKIDCSNNTCEGYDESCRWNCQYNSKVIMMCRLYEPEEKSIEGM